MALLRLETTTWAIKVVILSANSSFDGAKIQTNYESSKFWSRKCGKWSLFGREVIKMSIHYRMSLKYPSSLGEWPK